MNKFPDRASTEDLEGRRKPRELRAVRVMPKANTGVARGSNEPNRIKSVFFRLV
jgi:hypothetical protein